MKKTTLLFIFCSILSFSACNQEQYNTRTLQDNNGYTYNMVSNDPTNTRIYTLDNGLKVYLSVNKDEPRIMTCLSVRAGSLNDPQGSSGLAHYFEHLMFKGTDEFGTLNWAKEKPYIDSIAVMFEKHKNATTKTEKQEIYKEIDRLSQKAAVFAIPNEYDRLTSAIGATQTNAFTSYEQTTFVNEIPSNELKRWLRMEKERFSNPVFRLFHTELETVYEEFNMNQDQDKVRQKSVLMQNLFPHHPLGRQIIGYPNELRNPSLYDIRDFYRTWYVPNNMAVILSGDLEYEETIKMVDETFGKMKAKELPELNLPREAPIEHVIEKNVYGPAAENVMLAYRFDGIKSIDRKYVYMVDMILNNRVAGLIDLDLIQNHKVQGAGTSPEFQSDYGMHFIYGIPKKGQSLEEVKKMLLAELEKVRKGEFEDGLMDAILNYFKVEMIKMTETNDRVKMLTNAFVFNQSWADVLSVFEEMRPITKEQLVAFANERYKNNYVAVYKRLGDAENVEKIDKPFITPIDINRDAQSNYLQNFLSEKIEDIAPKFVNFDEMIERKEIKPGLELDYIKNVSNHLFNLVFIWDMGTQNDKNMALAMNYIPYLGTYKFSAEDISKAFYELGVTFNVYVKENQMYISLSGLDDKLLAGMALLEHLMACAQPDSVAYNNLVDRILKNRMDGKKNPVTIRTALIDYAKYGGASPTNNVLSEDELRSIDPKLLTNQISTFNNFKHRVFYYGPKSAIEMGAILKKHHRIERDMVDCPPQRIYEAREFAKSNVLFLNYPKSQAEVFFLAKDVPFDEQTMVNAKIFNEYYGENMSSIVFQEIREARALAYSAWAGYLDPINLNENFFLQAVLFTQTDKLKDAITVMDELLSDMIVSENSYHIATNNIVKNIQTNRITRKEIFWTWLEQKHMGINHDIRKDYYEAAQNLTINDVNTFFDEHIKGHKFTYIIIGNKEDIDFNELKTLGPVRELSLQEVFAY